MMVAWTERNPKWNGPHQFWWILTSKFWHQHPKKVSRIPSWFHENSGWCIIIGDIEYCKNENHHPERYTQKSWWTFRAIIPFHPDPYVHRQGCWLWPREDLETLDRGGIISSIRGGIWDASLSRTSFPMGFYCWSWRNQTDSPYKFEVGCPILTTWQAKTSRFWYLWISGWTILCR